MSDRNKLPLDLMERAVQHLRENYPPHFFEKIRRLRAADPEGWYVPYHFAVGMGVRNCLRAIIPDDQLPGVRYDHVEDSPLFKNWDDYYVEVMEAAADLNDSAERR